MLASRSQRVLIIDDEPVVRFSLQSVLEFRSPDKEPNPSHSQMPPFDVQACSNGAQGCAQLQQSLKEHRPFQVAFVDLYMPGDWDGLETIRRLWSLSPDLQIVLCTVLHGTSWQQIVQEVGYTDRLFILKKPFDPVEVLQLAGGLCNKWHLARDTKRHRETLEDTVTERTRELSQKNEALQSLNQELATAHDAAQAASQAKSAFLTNISHELRTPMTAILGFSDLIGRKSEPTDEVHQYANTIHRNAEHLLALINDTLDLANIETGKLDVEHTRFPLQPIIEELTETFRQQTTAKKLNFQTTVDSEVPREIQSDPQRVRQILTNLLSNAVKFTHEGQIKLRVLAVAQQSRLQLKVTDTGIGISPEQQERLFENFQQADNSISRKYGGTGLGLAITKHLTHLLGGQITIDSQLDQGTTFTVELPINEDLPSQGRTTCLHQTIVQAPPRNTVSDNDPSPEYPIRILLLEESSVLQRMMVYLFERLGATVTLVTEAALVYEFLRASLAQKSTYDLVIFSHGNEFEKALRFAQECRTTGYNGKLAAFLTRPLTEAEAAQLAQTCDGVVEKPVNFHKLAELLKEHFTSTEEKPERPANQLFEKAGTKSESSF